MKKTHILFFVSILLINFGFFALPNISKAYSELPTYNPSDYYDYGYEEEGGSYDYSDNEEYSNGYYDYGYNKKDSYLNNSYKNKKNYKDSYRKNYNYDYRNQNNYRKYSSSYNYAPSGYSYNDPVFNQYNYRGQSFAGYYYSDYRGYAPSVIY